jgi:hypothetical protein
MAWEPQHLVAGSEGSGVSPRVVSRGAARQVVHLYRVGGCDQPPPARASIEASAASGDEASPQAAAEAAAAGALLAQLR